jgi:ribosomal protein S18 acetylase RimI-like enzyme
MYRNDRLPDGYRLVQGPPSVGAYLELRLRSGLSPRREDQARAGLHGSWFAVHIVHEETMEAVGMGRVLGDGGWYFHVIDMAVVPEHQRRGLGDVVLTALLDRIRSCAPRGAFVNLLADPPGIALYSRHGFVATSPTSEGMALYLE